MIERSVTLTTTRSGSYFQTEPPYMTDAEHKAGCSWAFGGASEDEQSIHHTYVLHSPDEAPASTCNPSEADISRRVELLIELEPVCAQTEDPEGVRAQLRCVAIRQLLAERGGK